MSTPLFFMPAVLLLSCCGHFLCGTVSMANIQNLKPLRSVSEAREKGRNGGIKSGISRRKKKALREAYTKEAAFAELDELMNAAKETGNLTAAVRLAELKGKMCGYYVEKVAQTDTEGETVRPVVYINGVRADGTKIGAED